MTIEEWAKDFKSYVNALDMQRDDYKSIMEYIDDALALLKEQEAVKPTWQQGKAYCGSCGRRIPLKIGARFCHKCGQAVKWE